MMDRRKNRSQVIQSADVFVDAAGIIYSTDYNGVNPCAETRKLESGCVCCWLRGL